VSFLKALLSLFRDTNFSLPFAFFTLFFEFVSAILFRIFYLVVYKDMFFPLPVTSTAAFSLSFFPFNYYILPFFWKICVGLWLFSSRFGVWSLGSPTWFQSIIWFPSLWEFIFCLVFWYYLPFVRQGLQNKFIFLVGLSPIIIFLSVQLLRNWVLGLISVLLTNTIF